MNLEISFGGAHRGRIYIHVYRGECACVLWTSMLYCVILKIKKSFLFGDWTTSNFFPYLAIELQSSFNGGFSNAVATGSLIHSLDLPLLLSMPSLLALSPPPPPSSCVAWCLLCLPLLVRFARGTRREEMMAMMPVEWEKPRDGVVMREEIEA